MGLPKKLVDKLDPQTQAAVAALDAAYTVEDLRAKNIGQETGRVQGTPLNTITIPLLRRRCLEAQANGSNNIAVDVVLLIEFLNGIEHACKNGFEPQVTL